MSRFDREELKTCRSRVLEFESEFAERLQNLSSIEAQIDKISELRNEWLKNTADVTHQDTEIFRKRIEILKIQCEISEMKLTTDILRLDSVRESNTFKYLIFVTKPLDDDETDELREKEIAALLKQQSDSWKFNLQQSIDLRAKMQAFNHDLSRECESIKTDFKSEGEYVMAQLQDRVKDYVGRIREACKISRENHKKITADYLVLRHNARVAKEVLSRSQNDAISARKVLQEKLDTIVQEAISQVTYM